LSINNKGIARFYNPFDMERMTRGIGSTRKRLRIQNIYDIGKKWYRNNQTDRQI
jgi:hypothetical protein